MTIENKEKNNTHHHHHHHHNTSMKHKLSPTAMATTKQEVICGDRDKGENQSKRSVAAVQEGGGVGMVVAEVSGRERLKRHRGEVAGRVWIPEIWGQEEMLKDWVDGCGFDSYWMNNNIVLARTALVEDSRSHSTRLRIDNTC